MIRPLIPISFASALCAQTDPELFFPEKGGSTKSAKKICGRCLHIDECLEDAITQVNTWGIRGGKSEREQRALRSARNKEAVA